MAALIGIYAGPFKNHSAITQFIGADMRDLTGGERDESLGAIPVYSSAMLGSHQSTGSPSNKSSSGESKMEYPEVNIKNEPKFVDHGHGGGYGGYGGGCGDGFGFGGGAGGGLLLGALLGRGLLGGRDGDCGHGHGRSDDCSRSLF